MQERRRLCDLLAQLLSYPKAGYADAARACQELLRAEFPEQAAAFGRFVQYAQTAHSEEMEELFTRTFDLNPVCCLEAGWHLYGEDYNRGEFLVKMRQLLRQHGVAETIELPDHLSNLLPLLGRMKSEEAGPLCASFLLPALEKMQAGLEGRQNPYEPVLSAARQVAASLAAGYSRPAPPLIPISRKEEVVHD